MEPFISLRIGKDQHSDFRNFSAFINMIRENEGCCDEAWFSTHYGYPKIRDHVEFAAEVKECADYVREKGISVSLQISNTIGHGSSNAFRDFSGFVWDCMVGINGIESPYCACPRDDRFLSYVYDLVLAYMPAKPDRLWIDDDIRMNNHRPVGYGCFCDRCIREFNNSGNSSYTREELAELIHSTPEVRIRWIDFNKTSLKKLIASVCKAVMTGSPTTAVGIQMASFVSTTYNGDDFGYMFELIKELTGKPAVIRPGGGFYHDHEPREMIRKALVMGSAWRNVPSDVTVMKAEIENTPHAFAGKSILGLQMESVAALAYGCNSLSYSAFMRQNEDIGFYGSLMRGLADWRSFLEGYAKDSRGTLDGGGGMVMSPSHNKVRRADEPFYWSGFRGFEIVNLAFYGIPVGWANDSSSVLLLHHSEVDALDDREILEIFSRGVITDAQTVDKLNRRGLSYILDMDTVAFGDTRSCERSTGHQMNGKYAGMTWHNYGRRTEYPFPINLIPRANSAIIMSEYVLGDDKSHVTGISNVFQETSEKGRAAVFAYDPWPVQVNSSSRQRLLAAYDWVSGGSCRVRLETPSQTAVVPRIDPEGTLRTVMLLNVSISDSGILDLHVRCDKKSRFIWHEPLKKSVELRGEATANGFRLNVPSIKGWHAGYISIM